MRWGTSENERARAYVLEHGIEQFINIYNLYKNADGAPFLWGDELEHNLIRVDPVDGSVLLSLNAAEVLERLTHLENPQGTDWRPEYGSFMVESVPREPFTLSVDSLCSVEANQRKRYELLDAHAGENVISTTLVTFPLMGVGKFSTATSLESPFSLSIFVPDACINATHPRFANLTANIRLRRGRKVCIQVPLFMDTFTLERTVDKKLNVDATPVNQQIDCAASTTEKKMGGFDDDVEDDDARTATNGKTGSESVSPLTHLYTPATDYYYAQYEVDDKQKERVEQRYQACPCPIPSVTHPCVYMDCMAFGMGCDCLQVTMQLPNQTEARHVYDQLAILCPVFLALTSATPFQKGLLCDSDVRWLTIAASVDDRQRQEVPRIIKSRYDSISVFLSSSEPNVDKFNDHHVEINEAAFARLRAAGVDALLANHVAHLFIRDPLVMYDQMVEIDDTKRNEHFENIQSTNWQTVRFKPPPVDNPHNIGWRVEFRVMDIMPTPFENSAFSVFVILLVQAIRRFGATFYERMSDVDRNMGKAHHRNPCSEKYLFRKDWFASTVTTAAAEFDYFSLDQIFNGGGGLVGLVPLVKRYLEEADNGHLNVPQIREYVEFIAMRARGEIPTTAQYWRTFITTHPDYKHDSRISPAIAKDLVKRCHDLASGLTEDASYLPRGEFSRRCREKRAREE